jgi:hypothetical protein
MNSDPGIDFETESGKQGTSTNVRRNSENQANYFTESGCRNEVGFKIVGRPSPRKDIS